MRACRVGLLFLLSCVVLPARQAPGSPAPPSGSSTYFDVRTYGAKGDGAVKDTAAVQAAMDAAAKQGGGTVLLPPGKYLCGTIHLRSNVTVYL
jgi:polygalacturonase